MFPELSLDVLYEGGFSKSFWQSTLYIRRSNKEKESIEHFT